MPRRVLLVAWAPFFSGAERALLLLARGLRTSRYEPHAVVGTDGALRTQLLDAGIPTRVVPLRYADARHVASWLASVGRLVLEARRANASIVHANDMPSFQPAGYTARVLRFPAVSHLRFPDTATGFKWFLRPGFDRALFVSRYLLDEAQREAPDLFENRSEVVYDGVEFPSVPLDAERAERRRQLDLDDRVVVALTGQIAEVKGIWDFVDAAAVLAARGGPLPLFVVLGDDVKGGGALRRAMEERVQAMGLSPSFRFLGFRADAPALISLFDVIVVPSHVEPLGNATLEAMAAGRPVIGSRVGGIPEMVADGSTGLLVPPRYPAILAQAIATLAHDPSLRQRLGHAALTRAREMFSVELHVEHVTRIYDEAIASHGRQPGTNAR